MAAPPPVTPITTPITELLHRAAEGDRTALDELFASLYPELRRIAHNRLYAHGRVHSLGTTALVHESFVRLVDAAQVRVDDRRHFFAFAAKTMRNVIIDELRAAQADRRGGGAVHVPIDGDDGDDPLEIAAAAPDEEAMHVHEALKSLEALDPGLAEVVEMRYFGGYTEPEIADLLGITERTVRRRWTKARAALYLALKEPGSDAGPGLRWADEPDAGNSER